MQTHTILKTAFHPNSTAPYGLFVNYVSRASIRTALCGFWWCLYSLSSHTVHSIELGLDKFVEVLWQKIESDKQSVYCLHLNKSNNKWHFNAIVKFLSSIFSTFHDFECERRQRRALLQIEFVGAIVSWQCLHSILFSIWLRIQRLNDVWVTSLPIGWLIWAFCK